MATVGHNKPPGPAFGRPRWLIATGKSGKKLTSLRLEGSHAAEGGEAARSDSVGRGA
jgi:hypothetical protein